MKAILASAIPTGLALIADSAIGRDAMPLFLPDEGQWAISAVPACRVGRLGKNVAAKFAMRYIDALSILVMLHPADFEPQKQAIPAWLSLMDSALTVGSWLAIDQAGAAEAAVDFGAGQLALAMPSEVDICGAVEVATTLATIKTGDAILFPALAVTSAPGALVQAEICGQRVINLKIR